MRLATWNCQTGLDSNWDALDALNTDVICVQECEATVEQQVAEREGWSCAWAPGRYAKGLAVLARVPFKIENQEIAEPFYVTTMIGGGPMPFRFLGFWAMTEESVGLACAGNPPD